MKDVSTLLKLEQMPENDWITWTFGGLAIVLLTCGFLMMFTTIFTTRRK